jgi:hypothetical protein
MRTALDNLREEAIKWLLKRGYFQDSNGVWLKNPMWTKEQHMAEIVQTIQEAAAEQIAALGPSLESAIVEKLADAERQRRLTPIILGLENLKKMEVDLKKLDKPDMIFTIGETNEKVEAQTPKKIEEIKKHKEKMEKLNKAIQKAFDNGDLQDLNQLNQSIGKPDKAEGKPEGSGETA